MAVSIEPDHWRGYRRRYPLAILNWYEIVNDTVGGVPVSIKFCPLCGTGMAFRRDFDGVFTTLGVSGLLYNSDLLLYDRKSKSLWSQVMGQSAAPVKVNAWFLCPSNIQHGRTGKNNSRRQKVLSRDTGFKRDYGRSPYGDYD